MSLLLGLLIGFLSFPAFMCYRAMRSDGWDKSNITNVIRLIVHVALHPEDFGKMYYEDGSMPFWYIKYDELKDVVKTRPKDSSPWRAR